MTPRRIAGEAGEPGAAESGMTLVEILVVLAIIGVAAGATVLGVGAATRAPSAESEARRLAEQIQLAADDAMVTDRTLALEWDERGYRLVALGGDGSAGGGRDKGAFRRHGLPAGMRLTVVGATSPAVLGIDGTGVPFTARLANATDRWSIGYDGLKAMARRMAPR